MRKVVCNTTPLIPLLKIGKLDLLERLYSNIIVPIAVWQEVEADLIIMDETLGRSYARHLGLIYTGTLGILLKAKQIGYIPLVKPLLEELQEKGIWINSRVIKEVLSLAEEQP